MASVQEHVTLSANEYQISKVRVELGRVAALKLVLQAHPIITVKSVIDNLHRGFIEYPGYRYLHVHNVTFSRSISMHTHTQYLYHVSQPI